MKTEPQGLKYKSPYPDEVTYKSDKNFMVRLKVLIERRMKDAGYNVHNQRFDELIKYLSDAEDYLFSSVSPSSESGAGMKEALEEILENILKEPGDMNPKKHAARRLLGIIKYPDVAANEWPIHATGEQVGCQCSTEEQRYNCNKNCIHKPQIVRS